MIRYEHSFQPETRRPLRLPPPGSVDSQIHVFGDPLTPGRVYDPAFDATFERAQKMHRALGIAHGVVVQPTAYGTDHTLMLEALAENAAYRGTAIVDDGVSDEEDLLVHHGWWIMLSNADKHLDPPWDAAVPVAQAFIEAAPDRTLWATDWPHMGFRDRPVQNDADLLALFYRYAPDEDTVHRILVDNPTRLYGFADAR